jgi:NAD(P)-dependent dehydrogenase (short-subunit alcohol dehydrogenase family)
MTPIQRAVVLGGGRGVGRATAQALTSAGTRVWAPPHAELDATDGRAVAALFAAADPDLVVVTAGVKTHMAPIEDQTWETFSQPWQIDTRIAFEVGRAALAQPLRPGSTVVIVSSGAGLGGSPLSGGYAGAKRMQMFLAEYLQKRSDARKLGIRFVAIVPKQLLVGTQIGEMASAAYAAAAGITVEKFMSRFETPLDAEGAARGILAVARREAGGDATVLGLTGAGVGVI